MNNTLTYTKNGDYLIPDLKLSEQQSKPLGKVRQDAESVSEGTPPDSLQPSADEREAVPAPHRDRRNAAQTRLEQMMPQLTKGSGGDSRS